MSDEEVRDERMMRHVAEYVRDYARLLELSEMQAIADITRMLAEPAEPMRRAAVPAGARCTVADCVSPSGTDLTCPYTQCGYPGPPSSVVVPDETEEAR